MYAIEKELKILREFIRPEFINDLKKWKCCSEDEISAAEKRLHVKLPIPIRDIYRHMADLLVISGYLRPLELLHCEGNYLGFFLSPGEGDIIGIQKRKTSGDLYTWEENDPKEMAWEYEDELATACEEEDEEGKRRAAEAYQKYWKRLNIPFIHAPLNVHKLERGPRFHRSLDGYGLFLAIHAIQEWEEMTRDEHTHEPTCLFSDFFPAEFSMEYFQNIADRIKDDFIPLSDHPELVDLGDFPLQMAYVHKDQKALLILGQEPVCFMLLTKTAAGSDLLEKVQEQTGLAFHVGFQEQAGRTGK